MRDLDLIMGIDTPELLQDHSLDVLISFRCLLVSCICSLNMDGILLIPPLS